MKEKRWMATETTFPKAYPDVKTLRLTGTERGEFSSLFAKGRNDRQFSYSESHVPGKLLCSNPRCQQGGYDLNATLMAITGSRQTAYTADWHCNGHEGTPKGRRKGDPCTNSISFKLELTYQ